MRLYPARVLFRFQERHWLSVVGLIFVTLLALSWRRFGDLFLDYGQTLYGPFQVAKGLHVSRDFDWLYGPFSLYFNGALLALFGSTNTTLLVANLLLLIAASLVIYCLFSRWYGVLIASVIIVVFWFVFAFSHSTKVGIYNYFTPYNSETLHCLYLGILLVALAESWVFRPCSLTTVGLALLAALAFLTKVEMAVGVLAVWFGAYLAAGFQWEDKQRWRRAVFLGGGTFLIFLGVVFVAASFIMPPSKALKLVLGAWWMSFTPAARVRWNIETMGFDHPLENTGRLLLSTLAIPSFAYVIAVVGRSWKRLHLSKTAEIVALSVVAFVCVKCFSSFDVWRFLVRSLPFWCVTLVVAKSFSVLRRHKPLRPADLGIWLWSLWSVGTILRMVLNARVEQYGFTQAMPATLLCAASLLGEIPRLADRVQIDRRLTIVVVMALLFSFTFVHAKRSWGYLAQKNERWCTPTVDVFTFGREQDPRVPILRAAFEYAQKALKPEDKLLALPEGAFFAFSLGRLMATRYPQLTPTEVAGFGESQIVSDYVEKKPDVIVIIHKHTRPWLFGKSPEYGQEIMQWIHSNYKREALFGDEPHASEQTFGIEFLRAR